MYKLFLCLRYLRKRRIAIFAMASVSLCVLMVLVVVSVMGGFLDMVIERSRGMLADLVVEGGTLQGFPFYEPFIARLKREMGDDIEEATPVIITYGVLRFPKNDMTKPVQVVGVRLEETYRVNDFKEGLFYEKHYPGTTRFEKQRLPVVISGPQGRPVLPRELEEARARWQAGASRHEIDDAWRGGWGEIEIDAGALPGELNRGQVSGDFRKAVGLRLIIPDQVSVSVVEKGKKWLLRHEQGVATVRRNGRKLQVSHSAYPGPGYYRTAMEEPDFKTIAEMVQNGGWSGPPMPGIIIGTDIVAQRLRTGDFDRRHYRGEAVQLTLVPFSDKGVMEHASGVPTLLMRYVDDCRTGVFDIDSTSAYIDFDLLQQSVNMNSYVLETGDGEETATRPAGPVMPARTTQVQIKFKTARGMTDERMAAARARVEQIWDQVVRGELAKYRDQPEILDRIEWPLRWVKVQTWKEKQARFTAAVEKEKYLVTCLFGVISVVAVVLVGVIFYMIVQQKTRDIGIIKSVGATSSGVAGIFLAYGAAVGVVGGALGTVGGAIFVWYINDIQDLLIWIGGSSAQVWNPEVYNFDRIPNQVSPWDAVWIYGVAILASMLGSLVAAWKASRVWPVEALRYE